MASLLENTTGFIEWLGSLIKGFMQTTLIPFSITGIEMENLDFLPMLSVTTHVILGYVILAALVTRFAVMFQDTSP